MTTSRSTTSTREGPEKREGLTDMYLSERESRQRRNSCFDSMNSLFFG